MNLGGGLKMVVPRFLPFFLFLLVHSLHNEAQLFNAPKKEKKKYFVIQEEEKLPSVFGGHLIYICVNIAYRTYKYYYSP